MLRKIEVPPAPAKMRRRKFIVKPSVDGQYYIVQIGSNGRTTLGAETFRKQKSAIDSAVRAAQVQSDVYVLESDVTP